VCLFLLLLSAVGLAQTPAKRAPARKTETPQAAPEKALPAATPKNAAGR